MRRASRPPGAPAHDPVADGDGRALRALLQGTIRAFGLLAADTTPCGEPLAVSHAHALMTLLEGDRRGSAPGQRELGTALGIDKSNVARLCRRMEEAGHLRQARSRSDGRARLLHLTPRGRRVAEAVERASLARFAALAAAIPDGRRRAVVSALAVLHQAIAATAAPRAAATRSRPAGPRRTGEPP